MNKSHKPADEYSADNNKQCKVQWKKVRQHYLLLFESVEKQTTRLLPRSAHFQQSPEWYTTLLKANKRPQWALRVVICATAASFTAREAVVETAIINI